MNKQFLKLASGRKLSYRVYGNAQAEALIFFHGFPGSSIQGSLFDSSSYASQFHVISFDRPGFGESDFQDQRSLQSMAVDISEALGVLKINEVHLMGVSGGSPYAISMADSLGNRVKSLTLVCPLGPLYKKEVFKILPFKARILLLGAKHFPKIVGGILNKALGTGNKEDAIKLATKNDESSIVEKFSAGLPQSDIDVMTDEKVKPILKISLQEAFQQGVRGPMEDLRVFMSPWNVNFKNIRSTVKIYHGSEDSIVPNQVGQVLHQYIHNSEFHLIEGEGHYSLPIRCIDQILEKVPRT